jgi:hypothetical protein
LTKKPVGYPEEGGGNSLETLVTTHQTTRRLQYEISPSHKHKTTIAIYIVVHKNVGGDESEFEECATDHSLPFCFIV